MKCEPGNLNEHDSPKQNPHLHMNLILGFTHAEPWQFKGIASEQRQKNKQKFHSFENLLPDQGNPDVLVEGSEGVNEPG